MITFFQRTEISRREIVCLQTHRSPEAALGLKPQLVGLSELLPLPPHHLHQWLKTTRQPEKARLCRDEVNANHSPQEGPLGDTLQTSSCLRVVQRPQTARSNKTQWEQMQRVTFRLCKVRQREGDGFVKPAK